MDENPESPLQTEDFRQRVFNQFLDIWITPEVMRRQELGELPKPLDLRAAQILFYPDDRQPEVRINSEVKLRAEPVLRAGVSMVSGQLIYEHEIERIDKFWLSEEDDQDCGFAVVFRLQDTWELYFDFRYNKELAQRHLHLAEQFLETAQYAHEKDLEAPFIDNLFSAAELAAKAILLPHHLMMRTNKRHDRVQKFFSDFADLGNIEMTYKETFNKLRSLRNPARYADLDTEINVSKEEKENMLDQVKEMLKTARSMIAIHESE